MELSGEGMPKAPPKQTPNSKEFEGSVSRAWLEGLRLKKSLVMEKLREMGPVVVGHVMNVKSACVMPMLLRASLSAVTVCVSFAR